MFESVATDLQAHLWLWGLNQQVYLLHLPQTRSYIPMLVPNQRAGKHNCTRPSDMFVTVAPDQKPCIFFIICLLSVCNAACLLQFHFISIDVYYICTRPSAMSVTIAFDHLPGLSQLLLTSSYVWYTCTGPAFIFVIAIPNHLCCLLHLHQTSIVVKSVTIAPDQQACILQLHPTSNQDGRNICNMQISY